MFDFTKNATGMFVKGPCNTAKVVAGDILVGMSVLHVIDSVLLPASSGCTAAA